MRESRSPIKRGKGSVEQKPQSATWSLLEIRAQWACCDQESPNHVECTHKSPPPTVNTNLPCGWFDTSIPVCRWITRDYTRRTTARSLCHQPFIPLHPFCITAHTSPSKQGCPFNDINDAIDMTRFHPWSLLLLHRKRGWRYRESSLGTSPCRRIKLAIVNNGIGGRWWFSVVKALDGVFHESWSRQYVINIVTELR